MRTVTDIIPEFPNTEVTFYRRGGSFTMDEAYPPRQQSVTTDGNGAYSVELWPNTDGLSETSYLAVYPGKEAIPFVLEAGDDPITMAELRATENIDWASILTPAALSTERARYADTSSPVLGDALIGYMASVTGALGRTVHSKLAEQVSILDFLPAAQHAAIQAGTSTYDATASFNTALTQLSAIGGGVLFVPQGTYLLRTGAIRPQNTVIIVGAGIGVTILKQDPTNDTNGVVSTFDVGDTTPTAMPADSEFTTDWGIENLTIQGDDSYRFKMPLRLWLCRRVSVRNVEIQGGTHGGVVLEYFTEDCTLEHVTIHGVKTNPSVGGGGVGLWLFCGALRNKFTNILIEDTDGIGLALDAGTESGFSAEVADNTFTNVIVQRNGQGNRMYMGYGANLEGARRNTFANLILRDVGYGNTYDAVLNPLLMYAIVLNYDQHGLDSKLNVFTNLLIENSAFCGIGIFGGKDNTFANVTMHNINTLSTNYPYAVRVQNVDTYAGGSPAADAGTGDVAGNHFPGLKVIQDAGVGIYNYGVHFSKNIAFATVVERNVFTDSDFGDYAVDLYLVTSTATMTGANRNRVDADGRFSDEMWFQTKVGIGAPPSASDSKLYVHNNDGADAGLSSVAAYADGYLEVTADSANLASGLIGEARGNPAVGTSLTSTTMALRGVTGTARHQGAGTIASAAALYGFVRVTGGGILSAGYNAYFPSPVIDSGSIAQQFGSRYANQQVAGVTAGTAIYFDAQSGYVLYSVGGTSYHEGNFGVGTSAPGAKFHVRNVDATTAGDSVAMIASRTPSDGGTPAAGYGISHAYLLRSTTTNERNAARIVASWATATDASRKARLTLYAYDTAVREILRGEANGSAPMIGFLGATASLREAVAADASDLATAITLVNDLKAKLVTKGLIS